MELNDWILALHLLAAFALIGAEVVFTTMVVALWRSDSPTRVASTMFLARAGVAMIIVGTAGTVIFGVWLAIGLDAYQLWDGWVIVALVLWALGGYLGQKAGEGYTAGGELREAGRRGADLERELATEFGPSQGLLVPHRDDVVVAAAAHRHDLEARRMTVLASIRPDSWNFPLLLHILGAACSSASSPEPSS